MESKKPNFGDLKGEVSIDEKQESKEFIKSRWPHLVGKQSSEAMEHIKSERPDIRIFEVPQGSMVTMDFDTNRVRVYVDQFGKVVAPPTIG
eukprot:gene17539-24326_t